MPFNEKTFFFNEKNGKIKLHVINFACSKTNGRIQKILENLLEYEIILKLYTSLIEVKLIKVIYLAAYGNEHEAKQKKTNCCEKTFRCCLVFQLVNLCTYASLLYQSNSIFNNNYSSSGISHYSIVFGLIIKLYLTKISYSHFIHSDSDSQYNRKAEKKRNLINFSF